MLIVCDSSGSRNPSMTSCLNSGNSSRKRMPVCARLISPGLQFLPPPKIAELVALWCGVRKGRRFKSVSVFSTTPVIFAIAMLSARVGGGNSDAALLASILLPIPGGPDIKRLCFPASAIVSARFAFIWPLIWSNIMEFSGVAVFFTTLRKGLILCKFFKHNQSSCRFLTGNTLIFWATSAASFAFWEGIKMRS